MNSFNLKIRVILQITELFFIVYLVITYSLSASFLTSEILMCFEYPDCFS